MAYDQQYGGYPAQQQQRPYYDHQAAPPSSGASRGAMAPQQQSRGGGGGGMDPYGRGQAQADYGGQAQAGYSQQDRYQQPQNARVDDYVGYDDDILDGYGSDGHNQQAYAGGQQYPAQAGYGGVYAGQQDPRGPPPRQPPQQYREPPQRMPPQQGYGGGMNGGPPQGRGRGPPPRGYPPQQQNGYAPQQEFGPVRRAQTAPQGYDDQGQYAQQYNEPPLPTQSPPQQPPQQKPRERLVMNPISPKTLPYDNPFPNFPTPKTSPPNDAMAGMRISDSRSSQEGRRPRTSGSGKSHNSGRSIPRPGPALDRSYGSGGGAPRSSRDGYAAEPGFSPPSRAMTMPQNYDDPRRPNPNAPAMPNGGYNDMGAYGRGPQDPIQQRSQTSAGEMRGGPMQGPNRPSTATGMRGPPPNGPYPPSRGNPQYDEFQQPPPRNFAQPPRPGTSNGYREPPRIMEQRPGTSNGYREAAPPMQQRPPMTKEAQLDAYMPDFGNTQPQQAQPIVQDPNGLLLRGSHEANMNENGMSANPNPQMPYDMHKARSQPNLRAAGPGAAGYDTNEPMPRMLPLDPATGAPRRTPMPLVTDPGQMSRQQNGNGNGYGYQPQSPNGVRQFHRPGLPPIQRVGTAESAWRDPGLGRQGTGNQGGMGLVRTGTMPQQGTPLDVRMGGAPPQQMPSNAMHTGVSPIQQRPSNPDALPMHPTPVRPGHQASLGAQDIRQQQAARMSVDDTPGGGGRQSAPGITAQELFALREAVKAQPQNQKQALLLAKKLTEAAVVLADEGGMADARKTQRNREAFVNEAYKLVKKLVANSYTDAIFYLADCHGTGDLGLSVDSKEAFVLYQSAAKLGHGPSAYRTAVCCEMGQEGGGGTRRDPLKAVQWYRRGAALGDVPAMYKLGMILLKGHMGQPANLSEAIIWLERAAKQADEDNPHALHELAGIYESAPVTGNSITRDERYALELYTHAAKLHYRSAQSRLGAIYEYGQLGCSVDNRTSIHWYSKAAAQEDAEAELALSGWYLTGSVGILEQNDQEAYLWARKAALREHPRAEFAMGYFSETGLGCPKSFEDAKRWYGRSAAHRYPKAKQRLEELLKGGQKGMRSKERISRSDTKHEDCVVM